MREALQRWLAALGKLALSAGLLWMGVDLASASVPAAPAWVTPVDALATDSGRSHEHECYFFNICLRIMDGRLSRFLLKLC